MRLGTYTPGVPAEDRSAYYRYLELSGTPPNILNYYRDFGDRLIWASDAALFRDEGITPMVTWEPHEASLLHMHAGYYDAEFLAAANDIIAFGRPVLLRFAHEFNGDWYPWGEQPEMYREAFRRMVKVIRARTNLARFVWCPNVIGGADSIDAYYPGDAYVNWVGIDGYNWGGDRWRSFEKLFRPTYREARAIAPTKPIIIAETGCSEYGGSKAEWIRRAYLKEVLNFPQIKSICYFNKDATQEGGQDWRIDSTSASLRAYREVLQRA
jgi:beta-mannanase